jgi:cupin 2 domain-containing protein
LKKLFDLSQLPSKGEFVEEILHYKNIAIKKIVSSDTLETDTFLQEEAEWVMLLEGEAQIMMNDLCYNLQKGEYLFIPPLTQHTITKVKAGTIWLAIHIYEKESA